MTFSEGRHANVRMSWNTHLNDDSWNGEGKILSSKDIHYQRLVLGENGTFILQDETTLLHNGRPIVEDKDEISNFCRELDEFAAAVSENRAPLTDGMIGLNNVLLQEACLKSAAEGRVVRLEEGCRYVWYLPVRPDVWQPERLGALKRTLTFKSEIYGSFLEGLSCLLLKR